MPGVWESRFAELVRRLGSLRESTSLELLPDLMPVLQVTDPSASEHQWPRGEYPMWWGNVRAGGAAQYAAGLLWNPPGSNRLVTIDAVGACAGVGGGMAGTQLVPMSTSPAGAGWLGAAVSPAGLDSRPMDASGGTPVLSVVSVFEQAWGSTIATGGLPLAAAAGVCTMFPQTWVVSPGWAWVIAHRTTNTQLQWCVKWRERTLGQGHAEWMGARP